MILTSNSCDMNLNPYGVLGLSVFLRIPVSEPPKCTDPISRLATGSLLTDLKNLFKLNCQQQQSTIIINMTSQRTSGHVCQQQSTIVHQQEEQVRKAKNVNNNNQQ